MNGSVGNHADAIAPWIVTHAIAEDAPAGTREIHVDSTDGFIRGQMIVVGSCDPVLVNDVYGSYLYLSDGLSEDVFAGPQADIVTTHTTGLIDDGLLHEALKSMSELNVLGGAGHYVWYVDPTGEVHSWYDLNGDGVADEDEKDFVSDVYP